MSEPRTVLQIAASLARRDGLSDTASEADFNWLGKCSIELREANDATRALIAAKDAELSRQHERILELQMHAWKWMEAHDGLKSGRPYQFPSPTDLPEALAEIATLRAGIKRLSDEEELCAETTRDDPFSMVYLSAKLSAAEKEIRRHEVLFESKDETIRQLTEERSELRAALSKIVGYDRNFYDNGRPGYEAIARDALNQGASDA